MPGPPGPALLVADELQGVILIGKSAQVQRGSRPAAFRGLLYQFVSRCIIGIGNGPLPCDSDRGRQVQGDKVRETYFLKYCNTQFRLSGKLYP